MNYRFSDWGLASTVAGILGLAGFGLIYSGLFVAIPPVGQVMVVVAVLAAIAAAIADFVLGDRHVRRLRRFAEEHPGWRFAEATEAFAGRFLAYPFGTGREPADLWMLSGEYNGLPCATFTHRYEFGSKDDPQKTFWQIDIAPLRYPLRTLDIVPDDAFAKVAKFLGGQDIDFESHDFNKYWRVKAGDEKYAHDVIHPRVMERLLQPDALGLAVRIEGDAVYCWQAGRRGPEDLARRLGLVTTIAKLIPEFVIDEFKAIHEAADEAQRQREANAPEWARTPGALTSGRYTGIGAEDYEDIPWPPPFPDGTPRPTRPPDDPAGRGRTR